jgi:hypothetical protein
VVKRNVEEIREGIMRLLTDADLYQHYKVQLPTLAASLSWDEPVRQMADLFESWRHSLVKE